MVDGMKCNDLDEIGFGWNEAETSVGQGYCVELTGRLVERWLYVVAVAGCCGTCVQRQLTF